MAFIPPLMFNGFTQMSVTAASTVTLSVTTSAISDFFTNVFYHPGDSLIHTGIVCALIIIPCIGLIFLIMQLYKKCVKPQAPL